MHSTKISQMVPLHWSVILRLATQGPRALLCYERDFMMSLSDDKQADIIDAFNTTSRVL